jgi:hypothetical protein
MKIRIGASWLMTWYIADFALDLRISEEEKIFYGRKNHLLKEDCTAELVNWYVFCFF